MLTWHHHRGCVKKVAWSLGAAVTGITRYACADESLALLAPGVQISASLHDLWPQGMMYDLYYTSQLTFDTQLQKKIVHSPEPCTRVCSMYLIACERSTFGNDCILSSFFSFILTSNKFGLFGSCSSYAHAALCVTVVFWVVSSLSFWPFSNKVPTCWPWALAAPGI